MQLRRNRIRMGRINHIFISHLHGDHIFGLYGLLSSLNLMGREHSMHIYAPAGYEHILPRHLSDFDIILDFELKFTPLAGRDPAVVLSDKHLTVTAFPLKHRVPSFGFLFKERLRERSIVPEAINEYPIPVSQMKGIKQGKDLVRDDGAVVPNHQITLAPPDPLSYAYCSDTSYFERLSSFVKGVDLLYHEATFDSSLEEFALKTGHSTALDAARVASKAGVGRLVIGHFSSRYRDADPLVEEAATLFPETVAAHENMVIDVGSLRKG